MQIQNVKADDLTDVLALDKAAAPRVNSIDLKQM